MDQNDNSQSSNGSEPVGNRVRIFLRAKVWYANFQDGGKQHRISLETSSKKQARARAIRIEADLDAGRWKQPVRNVSVEAAISAYLSHLRSEQRSPKTLTKYECVFRRVAQLARARNIADLSGINQQFIDAYRAQRASDQTHVRTKYTETMIVRQLVKFAFTRDMVSKDPLKGYSLKKPRPTPQPCWKLEEVELILGASPKAIRPALTILAETGLRFGELAWLTWADVDFDAKVVHVRPKDDWKPKTGDCRTIPLSHRLIELLQSLPQRWRWVVTMPASKQRPQLGRQWTERRLLVSLKRVLKALSLKGKLHTLRHSFISNALLQGIPEAVVREWVGHVDAEVLRQYTHVPHDASQANMERLTRANERRQA